MLRLETLTWVFIFFFYILLETSGQWKQPGLKQMKLFCDLPACSLTAVAPPLAAHVRAAAQHIAGRHSNCSSCS